MAKKKGPDSLCTVKGMVMTLEERNRLMKLEYINNGKSLKDIADEYGLSHQTLKGLSSKEKWSEQRESQRVRFEQDVEDRLRDALGVIEIFAKAYIGTQLSDAVVFAVLIVVLLVKPAGLLGKQIREKV